VKEAGTTHTARTYSFEDSTAIGGSSYYRLQQADFDGSNSYSEVVYVQRELKGEKQRWRVTVNSASAAASAWFRSRSKYIYFLRKAGKAIQKKSE
jgi:hypothetical protein